MSKVSRLILGCLSYGSQAREEWVIDDQEEVSRYIEYASLSCIISFLSRIPNTTQLRSRNPDLRYSGCDSSCLLLWRPAVLKADSDRQMSPNGLSEVMLGPAVKELQLPRKELVTLTRVSRPSAVSPPVIMICNVHTERTGPSPPTTT